VGGRLILPLGSRSQVLCLVERNAGGLVEKMYDAVRFVPMLSGVE
jgi:protein-L-isoaspartate(D-aspartate) O-methyltransferase